MEMGHSPQRLESLAANCVGKNQAGVEESAELDREHVSDAGEDGGGKHRV